MDDPGWPVDRDRDELEHAAGAVRSDHQQSFLAVVVVFDEPDCLDTQSVSRLP